MFEICDAAHRMPAESESHAQAGSPPGAAPMLRRLRWLSSLVMAAALGACATPHPPHQAADDGWTAHVADPMFPADAGPVVLVDSAHGNWHVIDGRFAPFAELLRADGYQVRDAAAPISEEMLQSADIFVIANPVLGGEFSEWVLPTPPAFTDEEVAALERWVADGGSLLLIADHMPFPGSAEGLADAFGIVFINGFARPAVDESGRLAFSQDEGSLARHPITTGRNSSEAIPFVVSFTGQAFRAISPIEPLMTMPDDWRVFLPADADVVGDDTPSVSARGLLQGAIVRHGDGRLAVFGEAAMFSAQSFERDGELIRFGMNDPEAPHNAQFVVNVMHWLAGEID